MKLYISGPSLSFENICDELKKFRVDCKIVKNKSVSKTYQIENGYKIEIYECSKAKFLEVSRHLIETFGLDCAFVKVDGEYMGCINNWPGMTCKTNCPGSILH